MVRVENGGSLQPSSSNTGQFIAFRKMTEEELEPMVLNIVQRLIKPMLISIVEPFMKPMVISTVQQVVEPVAQDLCRRVVREEMQAVEDKLLTGGRQNHVLKERRLQLKFLDQVSGPVQTGKELKGVEGDPLKVALLDANEHIVTCGPESSAKVEIVLLDAGGNNDEKYLTHGNFERKIIGEEDKEKPHFAKSVYICLEKGVGLLIGLKLGHGKDWTKFCNCRLGVRIVQNISGVIVQEAWTAPFKVIDKRAKQYEKHDHPFLSSDVWRLNKIGRDGEPCKRLKNKNIKTVQDFRFWLSVDPEGLRQILCAGDSMWKTTVAHALTCIIDDKKLYSYKSFTKPQISVIYNTVGELEGVIDECHFVPTDNLSADKKDCALKLLTSILESAFGERYKTVFNNEASLLQEDPYRSSDINASINSSMQQCLNGNDITLPGKTEVYQTTELDFSSQTINSSNLHDIRPSYSIGSIDMGELCDLDAGPPDPKSIDEDTPTELATSDYEKHETPSLSGELSELVNICEDGVIHKCLRDNKINTVEEFLNQLLVDHEGLRKIVNLERHEWEATVSSARKWLQQKQGDGLRDVLQICSDNQSCPTGMPSEKEKVDADELLASGSKNWWDVNPPDSPHPGHECQYAVTSELVGEPSGGSLNAAFHSVSSTMEFFCHDNDYWPPGPPSPNPMLRYADDTYSYDTHQMSHDLIADEGTAATAGRQDGGTSAATEPQVVETITNPSYRLKRFSRQFSPFKEKMSQKRPQQDESIYYDKKWLGKSRSSKRLYAPKIQNLAEM